MKNKCLKLLKEIVSKDAQFRYQQFESIILLLETKKLLLVQKTGWGKSIIYFLVTRLLKEQNKGLTLIISPLLSLTRNQVDMAKKAGLNAAKINSNNKDDWDTIIDELKENKYDVLFITPERLANNYFKENVRNLLIEKTFMVVVDEAHCISDWGHDFRPDYQRIIEFTDKLKEDTLLLATTATASERVIEDINEYFAYDMEILRGPLIRDSLKMQVVNLKSRHFRLAWLAEHVNKMDGSGIIYCLTKRDCNQVASWLRRYNIDALEYYSGLDNDSNDEIRIERENKLINNDVKVLVATVALGMGFDKPDISFVVHYQNPSNIVNYYQQIGRAGRAIEEAYIIIFKGEEEKEINDYFINEAFPDEYELENIYNVIKDNPEGIRFNSILKYVDIKYNRLKKCIKQLDVKNHIYKNNDNKYYVSDNDWEKDEQKNNSIRYQRKKEFEKMKELLITKDCYMKFISKELGDKYSYECGNCTNCIGEKYFKETVRRDYLEDAKEYLKINSNEIKPRKFWPAGIVSDNRRKINNEFINQPGKFLSLYNDGGLGDLVKEDKYKNKYFRDELVEESAKILLKDKEIIEKIKWITSVPSNNHPYLVKSFSKRLSKKIGIPYLEIIQKKKSRKKQKELKNSYHKCKNVLESFYIEGEIINEPFLLIDDIVDSGWSLTVCGYKLRQSCSGEVYPFALASHR